MLRHYTNRFPTGCYLHKSTDHAFLQCRKLQKLYNKLNCVEHLDKAQANPEIPPADQSSLSSQPSPQPRSTNRPGTFRQPRLSAAPSTITLEQHAVARRAQCVERREEKLKKQKKEMKVLAKQQNQMLKVLRMQLAQNASTPYKRLDKNSFHMLDAENDGNSSDDESDSSSSSSSDDEATTVEINSDNITPAIEHPVDNNNSNVNTYHDSILRSSPGIITIKDAITECKRKAT